MIARFNLLLDHHFHHLFLVEILVDSCFWQRSGHLQSYTHRPCDILRTTFCGAVCFTPTTNEQQQCLICRLQVYSVNGHHIFHPFIFSADGKPNIDRQGRFQIVAWKFVLIVCFCKESFVRNSWWHWMFFIYKTKGIAPH